MGLTELSSQETRHSTTEGSNGENTTIVCVLTKCRLFNKLVTQRVRRLASHRFVRPAGAPF